MKRLLNQTRSPLRIVLFVCTTTHLSLLTPIRIICKCIRWTRDHSYAEGALPTFYHFQTRTRIMVNVLIIESSMNTTVLRENNNATINIRIPNIRYRSHFFVGRKTHPGQDVWPLLCFKSGFVGTSNSIGRNRLTRFSLLTLS